MPSTFEAHRVDASLPAEELASLPDAPYWAEHCAWVPGTGHCRNRGCSPDCIFRPQRLAERNQIVRDRRRRRSEHAPFAGRTR